MQCRIVWIIGLGVLALGPLTACNVIAAKAVSGASDEIIDEQSGSTLSVVTKPLVFARERTDVAAHARDYATLVALELDQSGKYAYNLLLYRWSTVDRRMSPPPEDNTGKLQILAEGRTIELTPLERVPIGLAKRKELHTPEHGDVVTHAYAIDVATLKFIANSRVLSVRMPQETFDSPFSLWQDGRKELQGFLLRVGAP